MNYKKINYDILPLVIAFVLMLISIIVVSTSNYVLSTKHFLGIGCLILSSFFYFKNRVAFYLIFGLVLLLGVFGPIDFYFRTYKIGFGSFGINPIFLGLLILHFALVLELAKKMDEHE